MTQIDSKPNKLTTEEWHAFNAAFEEIRTEASKHAHRRPKLTTLLEEFSEVVLASRGKHDDPLSLEVRQVASVAANCLWQIILYGDDEVANLRTHKEDQTEDKHV